MSKGDKRRPIQITTKQFDDKWDRIFNKKCPQCREGTLRYIKGDETYTTDHYMCNHCDSTYNIGQV